jgi:hypothetical protein
MHSKQNKKPKLTDAERHNRFVEAASKVEASDNPSDFDKAFDGLEMRTTPQPSSPKAASKT